MWWSHLQHETRVKMLEESKEEVGLKLEHRALIVEWVR
jgi:hypothetical protein